MATPEEQQSAEHRDAEKVRAEWERKRRRAEIFGEVLPETTRDERDQGSSGERGTDAWLRAQVPPHHGQV